jgi:hypothetical protein
MAALAAKEAATAEQVSAELAADQLDEDEIMATNNFCITNAVSAINAKFAIEKDDMTIIPSPGVSKKGHCVLWSVSFYFRWQAMRLWLIANYEILCEGVVGTYMNERHVKVAKVAITVGVKSFMNQLF